MKRLNRLLAGLSTPLALVLAAPASAHHSFAMFDQTKLVVLEGTVKEVQWVNPHTWIQINVPTKGKTVEWSIEGRSPNVLTRRGWSKTTVQAGDKVALTIHPLKNGQPGGAITRIKLANGQELNADTPTAVDTDEEGPRQ